MPDTDPPDGGERHAGGKGAVTEFGRLSHRYRQAAGLTQEKLAELSGLSVRSIRDMERGVARAPQRRSVAALADILGLSGDALAQFQAAARAGRSRSTAPPANRSTVDTDALGVGLCEVPPLLGALIGREAELAWLRGFVAGTGNSPHRMVATITGQPGIGKTTLAVWAAHDLRPQFPDGVYFVDLRGLDDQPLSGFDALGRVLRSLRVDEASLPRTIDERASLCRSLMRGRRMLLVLDNARDEAQVRPLLPGSGSSRVITTSRRALTGLDGVHRLQLEVLARDAALRLLDVAAGAGRVPAEREAATEVAELCGYLPLALRIAGNRLAARGRWTIRFLADQLADQRRRLTLLTAGDRQVRAAFDVSYQQLSPTGRLVFRRLALVPGADFGAGIAAVTAGVSELEAIEALDELVDASVLLPASREGRYFFHNLLRVYVGEQLAAEETADAARAAERDLSDWLLSNVVAAGRFLDPDFADDPPRDTELTDSAAAVRWLDDESGNWLPALTRAVEGGQHERVVAVARALRWYSDVRMDGFPWHDIFDRGVASARAAGSRRDEVVLLNRLCLATYMCLARFEEALEIQAEALATAREIGDLREQGWALAYGTSITRRLGRTVEAEAAGRAAVAAFHEIGYGVGEMHASYQLGNASRELGHFDEALAAHQNVLTYHRGLDGAEGVNLGMRALALLAIGDDYEAMCRWRESFDAYREAQEVSVGAGHRGLAGVALRGQGLACIGMGRPAQARTILLEALEIFVEGGDRWEAAHTKRSIGDAARNLGDTAQALTWWIRALRTCEQLASDATVEDLTAELRRRLAAVAEADAGPSVAGAG